MRRIPALVLSLTLFTFPVCAQTLPELPPGPLLLTSVTPEMFEPEFWIGRLPEPDRLIKTASEIRAFNKDIRAMVRDQVDIFELGFQRSGGPVKEQIELEYRTLRGRTLWGMDDARVPKSIFEDRIRPLLNLDAVPSTIKVRFGAAIRETSVRALPSDVIMLEQPRDYEFNQLQFTLIKMWTPVAVLHTSKDGAWYYIKAPSARGWVKSKDIAVFNNRDSLKKYVRSPDFLVVTGESVPVFGDSALSSVHERASMGTVLPLLKTGEGLFSVAIPGRSASGASIHTGYVSRRADTRLNFLPYTQANIIRQAFKMLGARYGWGGTYRGRDCSGFTQDVYLPFGIEMPRGSKEQAFAGTQIGHFEYKEDHAERKAVLQNAVPAITLMRMPHHMMIYLGEINGQFYAIHSTWAERFSMTSDEKNRINQVVVSDLTLNGRSHLGTLFERIIMISELN